MSIRCSVLLAAILALISAMLPFSQPVVANSDQVPDQYIVVFKDTVRDPTVKAQGLAAQHGVALQHIYEHALKGFAGVLPAARLAELQADPDVAYVVQDQVVTIFDQTTPTGINRIDGELSLTAKIDGKDERVDADVAVIDTGMQGNHSDLNVVGGYNCLTQN